MDETSLELSATFNEVVLQENPEIPNYMQDVYDWAYIKPQHVAKLDCNLVVRVLLFLQDQRLMRAYLKRIKPTMHVWQVAHVYGDLVSRAAKQCGINGLFHLTDITPIQVEHAIRKLAQYSWAKVFHADAAIFKPKNQQYDLICSFFLLHEVPDEWKRRIVNNMLSQLTTAGELVFVDYHKPKWWQPIGYILQLVNHYLEPFAKSLWTNEISSFVNRPELYTWDKKTIFAGVYQIVSVRRKTCV